MTSIYRTFIKLNRVVLVCFSISTTFLVEAQTPQFLEAPVVHDELRVQLDAAGKKIEWAADLGRTFRALDTDKLFLTKESFKITYPQYNPLKLQASASVVAADDPSSAVMAQLLTALASVGSTVIPAPTSPTNANISSLQAGLAPANDSACSTSVAWLQENIMGSSYPKLGDKVKSWVESIDKAFDSGSTGPGAVQQALRLINDDLNGIQANFIDKATANLKTLDGCASGLDDGSAKVAYYSYSVIINQYVQKLTAFKSKAQDLRTALGEYAPRQKWMGAGLVDFVIGDEVKPTREKMQNVTLKIAGLTLKVDAASSELTSTTQEAASVKFSARKFARFTPELGAGVVISTVKQHNYGTAQNAAGKTIVAQTPDSTVSVNPAVMVNFVCRCQGGWINPMVQIGATASKSVPGIVTGLGIRLLGAGKGDIAVGGGAMFGWTKDLQKLKVGDIVSGTQDITSDLGFKSSPHIGAYLTMQYKF